MHFAFDMAVNFSGAGTESYCLSVKCLPWAHILNVWSQPNVLIITGMDHNRGSRSPGASS